MSSRKGAAETARSVVDHRQELRHPLDYSFKAVTRFEDLLEERPRMRGRRPVSPQPNEEEEEGHQGQPEKSDSATLKVNNNLLADWDGFTDAVHRLFEAPSRLAWVDLSYNDLRTIDKALVELPSLTILYLHGNNIDSISEVDKLGVLVQLRSLALHGNPVEMGAGYRHYVLSHLPQLQTLDFSGVTKADRATAATWKTLIAPKPRNKRKS